MFWFIIGVERYNTQAARTVFIGTVSDSVTDDTIRQIFRDCGRIVAIRWLHHKQTKRFKK
jgi:RNA recognition motif-containing protein